MARRSALMASLIVLGCLSAAAIAGTEMTDRGSERGPDGASSMLPAQSDEELFAEGRDVFRRCQSCHVIETERNLVGPHLVGLFGRVSGTVEGFRYSDAMVEAAIVWDDETLTAYLHSPRDYIPGNRMAFPGLTDEDLITALLAFLRRSTAPAE